MISIISIVPFIVDTSFSPSIKSSHLIAILYVPFSIFLSLIKSSKGNTILPSKIFRELLFLSILPSKIFIGGFPKNLATNKFLGFIYKFSGLSYC